MLTGIISNGRPGGHLAALVAAKALGLKHGGYADKRSQVLNLSTLDGDQTPIEMNLEIADGVLWLGCTDPLMETLARMCFDFPKPFLNIDEYQSRTAGSQLRIWVLRHKIQTLYVGGRAEKDSPGIGSAVQGFLMAQLPELMR